MLNMKGNYYTMKELQKLRVIHNVIDKKMTGIEAAEILKVSERQIRRIVKKVRDLGDVGIKHQNTFNKPSSFIDYDKRNLIIKLKLEKYPDTNFMHFRELLEEKENISIAYSTVYNILSAHGITSKKQKRRRKIIHLSRPRKTAVGELLQLDASTHDWFSTGTYYHLHGSIDDASGKITGLWMDKEETTNAYFEVMKQTITNFGIPIALYTDGRTVFFSGRDSSLSDDEIAAGIEEKKTQFTTAVDELGIEVIHAHSPQAKGRIERLWQTLQDRLVVIFRMNNITTINDANEYLVKTFIDDFNKKFSIEVSDTEFIPLRKDIDLELVLAKRFVRSISSDSDFSFNNHRYLIVDEKYNLVSIQPKYTITIIVTTSGLHKILYDKKYYNMILRDEYFNILEFKRNNDSYSINDIKILVTLIITKDLVTV